MGLTATQKPQVFFLEKPDKPQLAERLLTKNQGNTAPLHHLLPVTLHLNLHPLSPGDKAPNCGTACMPTFARTLSLTCTISHKHFSLDKSSDWPRDWTVYICSLSSLYLVVFTARLSQRITQRISLLSSAWSETSCNTSLHLVFTLCFTGRCSSSMAPTQPLFSQLGQVLLYRICSKEPAALATNRNVFSVRTTISKRESCIFSILRRFNDFLRSWRDSRLFFRYRLNLLSFLRTVTR